MSMSVTFVIQLKIFRLTNSFRLEKRPTSFCLCRLIPVTIGVEKNTTSISFAMLNAVPYCFNTSEGNPISIVLMCKKGRN